MNNESAALQVERDQLMHSNSNATATACISLHLEAEIAALVAQQENLNL